MYIQDLSPSLWGCAEFQSLVLPHYVVSLHRRTKTLSGDKNAHDVLLGGRRKDMQAPQN